MSKDRNVLAGVGGSDLGLRPLTARSVMLSALLGTQPPRLPVRALVRVGELFGIPEGTVRVALSRMAADGDVVAVDGVYALGERLRARASRQDESRAPALRRWAGRWELAVVTGAARSPAERAALRREMVALRLGEPREGVWLRPANLQRPRPWPPELSRRCLWFDARPDGDPVELARTLWDLDAWADRARRLAAALGSTGSLAHGFTVSAAVLHHLLADPLLPEALLPSDWPGPALRERYDRFDASYRARLRDALRPTS